MNKTLLVSGLVVLLLIVGFVSLKHKGTVVPATNTAAVAAATQAAQASPANVSIASSSTVPLMQSTGALFSQSKYASKSYEIYPTLASGTKSALGAFSYTKTALSGGAYRFTLTNDAEGFKGQSVVVGQGQTLYFIEPSRGDDSPSEDSATTDDFFVVVDAQGNILK